MTYEQTLAKLNILVYNGSYTASVISNKSISYTISGSNDFTDGGVTYTGIITLSVPYGVYSIEIAESTYHKSYTGTVEVLGDTTKEIHLTPYYNLTGSVVTTGAASVPLSNTSLYVYNSSSELVETITTDSNGNFTSDSVYLSGFTGFIRSPHIQQGDYSIESMNYHFTVTDTPTHVTSNINFSPTASLASKDVTFYVQKDGYTYQSSATKPTITVNGESQTVDPNGNTFSLPYGSHTVEISSTNYNDSLSESITVSDSTSSYTYSVTGYYDLRVETKWYYDNNSSNSSVWSNNFTVNLYNLSNTSTVLATSTSNSTGDAYFYVSGNYKINGTTTYYLNIPEQKLGDGACVVSNNNYVGLDYDNSDIQSNGHGGNQIYISYVLQLKTYTWQAIVTRDGSNYYYTGINITLTNKNNSNITYSSTTNRGVATFSSLPWGKYNVSIDSTTYAYGLSTSCEEFDLTYATFSTTFDLTANYSIRARIACSDSVYRSGITVFLLDSTDTKVSTVTTDSNGYATFSRSVVLQGGSSFTVSVPTQTVGSYAISQNSRTGYVYPNGGWGTKIYIYYTDFYDYMDFVGPTVTVTQQSTEVTRTIYGSSIYSYNLQVLETKAYYSKSYSTLSSYSLSGSGYGMYVNNTSDHQTYFRWPLGCAIKWGSKDWSIQFGVNTSAIQSLCYYRDLNPKYFPNVGVRVGSTTSNDINCKSRIGLLLAYTSNYQPALIIDNNQNANWSMYTGTLGWGTAIGADTYFFGLIAKYSASTRQVTLSRYYKTVDNILDSYTFNVSLSDDSSESYVTALFCNNIQLSYIIVKGYY